MAKKKSTKPITGTGRDPERQLTVQKSNPLYGLWRSELTLSEFKILDTYLSRINSYEPEKRSVRFEKGEIERLLGVKKINRPELQDRLKHLGTMVPIDDPTKPKGFRLISLFERADCDQDEDGVWQVDLTCTPSALKYIFNLDDIGYIKYKLRVVTSLRSRYAYILFLYLEKNRRLHLSWEVSVDELRDLMKADEPLYQQFKYFNAQLLKPVQKELSEKTDCKFSYEPVKKGRYVKAVRFTLTPLADENDIPGQMKLTDIADFLPIGEDEDYNPNQYTLENWQESRRAEICHGFESEEFADFSDEQLEALKDLGWAKKRDEDVERHNSVLGDMPLACQYATSDYLRQKILVAKTRHPKNLFLYVKKMIEND